MIAAINISRMTKWFELGLDIGAMTFGALLVVGPLMVLLVVVLRSLGKTKR